MTISLTGQDSRVMTSEAPIFIQKGYSRDLQGFREYILSSIDYPLIGMERIKERRYVFEFSIDSVGNIVEIELISGLQDDLSRKIEEIMNNSPKWIPGRMNGNPVKVKFTIPFQYFFKKDN